MGKWITYLPKYNGADFDGIVSMELKSHGTIDNRTILKLGCDLMIKKLDRAIQFIDEHDSKDEEENTLEIMMDGENDTLGHVLVSHLMEQKNKVAYASYKMNRYAGYQMTLMIRTEGSHKPKSIIIDTLKTIKKSFQKIGSDI